MPKDQQRAETDANGAPVIHEYDGIQECDNELPRWWLFTLYAAIAFAAGYWIHYQTLETGTLPSKEYATQQAAALALEAERLKQAGEVTNEALLTMAKDVKTIEQGKEVFAQTCVTCHEANGEGKIGPNLTDEFWLHGSEPMDIYKMVKDGYLPKQMPAWGKVIGEEKVRSVAAYVVTLRGKNLPGKAPQGEPAGKK